MRPSALLNSLHEARRSLDALVEDTAAHQAIAAASEMMVAAFQSAGTVFSCGNGGSMCDAMHFAEELSGRFRLDRRPLAALALADPAHISCVANDYGYEQVFARYLEALARPGDCLLAISTSGRSPNVLAAARAARTRGARVIALTGARQSALGALADVEIATPAGRFSDRVQELHIKVIHILIELVEHELFGVPAD